MELKLRPGANDVIMHPQGPGQAIMTIKAQIVNFDNDTDGVAFWFKKSNGDIIIEKHLLPLNPNDLELKFLLEADVVNKLIESRSPFFLVNFAGNSADLRLGIRGRLAMGQEKAPSAPENPAPKDASVEEAIAQEPLKIEPEPKVQAHSTKKPLSTALIAAIVSGVLLLAIIAFALWYFLLRADEVVAPQATAPVPTTEENAVVAEDQAKQDDGLKQDNAVAAPAVSSAQVATGGVSFGSCDLNSNSDDKALISECMATKPDNATLLKLGNEAMSSERCDIATRIFSSLGRAGAEGAALTYAQYFDPKSNLNSKCVKKDEAQAKYWYEKAKNSSSASDVKAATSALESMK